MSKKRKFMKLAGMLVVVAMLFAALPVTKAAAQADEVGPALQSGGDRLTSVQNNDGGWDWYEDEDLTNSSSVNILGPTAMGLAEAYEFTKDSDHLTALQNAGALFLLKADYFSPSDGYLAAVLDDIFEVTTYTDHVKANYYDKLADGTYNHKGLGTLYDTAGYISYVRTLRANKGIANLAAWDIGMGLVGAAACGMDTSAWIAGTKAEIDELDGAGDYDVLGLSGALYGLAYVGEEFDPTAGEHAAAANLVDLANILASYQISSGGFADNSGAVSLGNETIQETAYAILALNKVDRAAYLNNIISAADYMLSVQFAMGGWENEIDDGENNEITGEALWGISVAYPQLWVCPSGDCGHPDAEFMSIQAAIDAAAVGATINVAPGTYDEENILITKGLTLQGAGADTTFIAPSAVTNASTIVVQNPTSDVLIDGFTFVMQPKLDYGSAVVVTGTAIEVDSATVTISHNVVNGSGDGVAADFGFYGQGNHAKLVITDNVISMTGDNPICMEKQMGSTLVSSNTIYITNNVDYSPYFSMTYGGNIVTTPQIVAGNTFYMDHAGTERTEAITFVSAALGNWNNDSADSGGYRDVQITNNVIYGGGEGARGIGIFDNSHADNQGTISGVEISGNQFIGESPTDPTTIGIYLYGDIEGAEITGNSIEGVLTGMQLKKGFKNAVEPSGTVIENNKIINTGTALLWEGTVELDASPNWWGSIAGPAAEQIVGEVAFSPWCGDEDCSFTVPDENGVITLFGNINVPGGIVVDQPGLTFLLEDGTVIENNSPCFVINADYTTITTESPLGATCVPTADSNGIEVNGNRVNIIIEGLDIDGVTGTNGIDFDGVVTDLIIRDNYFHGLAGAGLNFAAEPAGTVQIQGNLFMDNAGNGIEAGDFNIPAEYNAWGHIDGAASGDGVSVNVVAEPWTHVDLYLESSGTVYPDQVVQSNQITYTVKGDFANVMGADFILEYPAELSVALTSLGGLFDSEAIDATIAGELHFLGNQMGSETNPASLPISDAGLTLFTVTFNGDTLGKSLKLFFKDETSDGFSMAPGYGPSTNIYAAALVDVEDLEVIDLPTLTGDDLDRDFIAGLEELFGVSTDNPAEGGEFTNVLFNYTISDTVLADIYSFQYPDGIGGWIDMPLTQDGADVVGSFGPSAGFAMPAPYAVTTQFRVVFKNPGDYNVVITLDDVLKDWELARLEKTVSVLGDFDVTGTISMQGRSVRSGVPLSLTAMSLPAYGPYNATSTGVISNNVLFTGVNGGLYEITTAQPRYLNVTADLDKQFEVDGDETLAALELKGGNAQWSDNIIDISDAAYVGGQYGNEVFDDGDVNFDNRVNIQDLALVGGNFDQTSADFYGTWLP